MIKFTTHAVKYPGGKARVHYSKGGYTAKSGYSEDTISVYAREYGSQLPKELFPKNETDYMTDYFDTDTARISPNSPHYKSALKAFMKQEEKRKKLMEKRMLKYK